MPNHEPSVQEVERRLHALVEELSLLPDLPAVIALREQATTCTASIRKAAQSTSELVDAGLPRIVDDLAADARVLRNALLQRPSRLRRHRP